MNLHIGIYIIRKKLDLKIEIPVCKPIKLNQFFI